MHTRGYAQLRQGRVSITGQIYHIVSRTYQRQPIFHDWQAASAACAAFTSAQALKQSQLLCWALMPDHAHWLLQLDEHDDISSLVGRMKSLSSNAARQYLQRHGKIWQHGFYDRAIRQEDDLPAVARYIVANPVRKGLCQSVRYYPFWNAVYF